MLDLGNIRQATQLWICSDPESDYSALTQALHSCNTARDRMLTGDISLDDYLDVLTDNGVNLDEYEETVNNNLSELCA